MTHPPADPSAAARKAVLKLVAASVSLMGALAVWIVDRDGLFGAVAAVSSIVIAGPIVLLVAIDTGKALRLAGSRSALLGLPELILGVLACLGAAGGVWLLFFGSLKSPFFISCSFFIGALLLLGARWLRDCWQATRR